MHGFKYCSPSRRSLLSGRFPVHISTQQAPDCSNFLPLQMELLSSKLKRANYSTHFIGKGHLGYQTTDHLPVKRGFDTHVGYLAGDQQYEHGLSIMCDVPQLANLPEASWSGRWPPRNPPDQCHLDMWQGQGVADAPFLESFEYSTDKYAAEAVRRIENKAAGEPLFIYRAWRAVHGPWVLPDNTTTATATDTASRLLQQSDVGYDNYCSRHPLPLPNPDDPSGDVPARVQVERCQFGSMLKVLDTAMHNITATLRARGLWDSTLMLMMSDNGGIGPGNNYPLRGQKSTPWQGGTRVAAYATGGFVPPGVRGAQLRSTLQFADVYPTLCNLAGVSADDTPVIRGMPRPIDGKNFWPLLLNSSRGGSANASAEVHEFLPTTENSIIWRGRWKLITDATLGGWYPKGGRGPNNTMLRPDPAEWPCVNASEPAAGCHVCNTDKPCLFDLWNDEAERVNLATQHPGVVQKLQAQLASYTPYVDGTMSAQELQGYDCVQPRGYPHAWWGNFTGPCCRPKKQKAQSQSQQSQVTKSPPT